MKPITAQGAHKVTAEFEQALCDYTGSPYAVAVDNATNGIALCLWRWRESNLTLPIIAIPARTYPSVAAEIVMAGFRIKFYQVNGTTLTGAYRLEPSNIWDSALRFSADMFIPGSMMCVSFTGCHKPLKLGKGGAILCDNESDYEWLRRARNSGRGEMSYHDDVFTQLGRNCYMHPSVAALGLQLMGQFYKMDGTKKHNADVELPYPDLSDPKHTAFR